MTKDLQKQIEKLQKIIKEAEDFVNKNTPDQIYKDNLIESAKIAFNRIDIGRIALPIIKNLQEEVERYKLLWETSSEGARVIIAEQEEEIKQLKEKLNDK